MRRGRVKTSSIERSLTLERNTSDKGKDTINVSVVDGGLGGTQDWIAQGSKLTTFDRRMHEFDFFSKRETIRQRQQSVFWWMKLSPLPNQFNPSMDRDQRHARLPAASFSSARVKPLHVRKASSSSQIHFARSQSSLNNHGSDQSTPEKPVYPPRTSSIRIHSSYCDRITSHPHATRAKTPSIPPNSGESSVSTGSGAYYPSNTSADACSTTGSIGHSTISSSKSRFLSDTSSSIMGDFVPIDSPNMAGLQPDMDPNQGSLRG